MTREDIEKAAADYAYKEWGGGGFECASQDSFIAGAEWRINSVWHKPNEEPARFCYLLLIELKNGEFDLCYKFDAAITKRWAYVEDLIPINENKK